LKKFEKLKKHIQKTLSEYGKTSSEDTKKQHSLYKEFCESYLKVLNIMESCTDEQQLKYYARELASLTKQMIQVDIRKDKNTN
jgi:type IV secretory pathway VirB4 component